jgi:nucleotide-binding universal stress UspA family protein
LARRVGSKITLLHVIEPVPAYSDVVDPVILGSNFWLTKAKKAFQKLCDEDKVGQSLVRNTLIRDGTPHHEITEAARELGADLIIIATNGRTGLTHVLLGSTAERVVRHAPCPVLVVREKEQEFIRH